MTAHQLQFPNVAIGADDAGQFDCTGNPRLACGERVYRLYAMQEARGAHSPADSDCRAFYCRGPDGLGGLRCGGASEWREVDCV